MNPMHAIHDALRQQSYPLDRDGVYHAVGDLTLFDTTGSPIAIRDVLTRSDRFEFATPQEIVDEIERCIGRA